MDSKNVAGGVKVTYIETQFVTSDAAGFKDLVQRLTGRSGAKAPGAAAVPDQVPRAWRADAANGGGLASAAAPAAPQGYYYDTTAPADILGLAGAHAQAGLGLEEQELHQLHEMGVFSNLFFDSTSERGLPTHGGGGAGYPYDFPY